MSPEKPQCPFRRDPAQGIGRRADSLGGCQAYPGPHSEVSDDVKDPCAARPAAETAVPHKGAARVGCKGRAEEIHCGRGA
jgi:hypothetical protein